MRALEFNGRGSEYFRIWIVNILLTIVTLTIYYPWAKVRTLRYFHGNTTLQARAFDYHATGKQLLPGYLISLVLVAIFVAVQTVFPVAGLALIAVLALAVPWLIWKSVMFTMRMTSLSAVRFGFQGTAGGAYKSYLFWPLLMVAGFLLGPAIGIALTAFELVDGAMVAVVAGVASLIGYLIAFLLYAKVKERQTHFLIDGYRYGQGRFATTVRTGGFAKILLKTIGLALLMLLLTLVLIAGATFLTGAASGLMELAGSLDDPEALAEALGGGVVAIVIGALYVGLLFGLFLIAAYAYTRQRQYILANSTLDGSISFASTLSARRFAWVLLTNLLLIVVTLGLGIPWARTRLARALVENTKVDTTIGFDNYINRQSDAQSGLAEQIGDAFDVNVGVGF